MKTEKVNLVEMPKPPADYHCSCHYCTRYLGDLVRPDGTPYNKNDRKKYYSPEELSKSNVGEKGGHVAKTPLHIARWAIQTYTKPGDWVLDPTIGAGTTAVEALNHGRCVAGMELEFMNVLKANIVAQNPAPGTFKVWHGDARSIDKCLKELDKEFSLIVNNPPYSGDESQKGMKVREGFTYDQNLPNLAFMKEGPAYYETMGMIYKASAGFLKKGGRLVIGVKDQMRQKKPDMLHEKLNDCVMFHVPGMKFEGMATLRHYPTTLFLNTYFRQFGIHPPYFQTISVFKKVK